MNKLIFGAVLLLALSSACLGQQPKPTPTPIPRIKCYPIESNGKIVGWNCVDVPPECVLDRKPPKRTGAK